MTITPTQHNFAILKSVHDQNKMELKKQIKKLHCSVVQNVAFTVTAPHCADKADVKDDVLGQ